MSTFYGCGSTVSRLQSHQEEIILFITKFTEIPGTHWINLGKIKG